ncbi:uncharacterized protein VTP21DRAFT_8501 [Calcarisporiella thermophila]|uniref:uncharacterized protein n=1 Tax=Calcarisporiella thermophila TaxID=911321 RepID=UPI0037422626
MAAFRDHKSTIFVGGLDEQVNEQTLHAAFLPFGEIITVNMPPDPSSHNKHRGFGFIEFEHAEDAKAAVDNMHLSELFGRTIKVNLSRNVNVRDGAGPRAIWSEEAYMDKYSNIKASDETNQPKENPANASTDNESKQD